jgi:hypothetical protein
MARSDPHNISTMAAINNVERSEPTPVGSEGELLWSMLDYYRNTLLKKCEGLDEEQLRRCSVEPSDLNLFDLLRHLTGAERVWFQKEFLGRTIEPLSLLTSDGEYDPSDTTPVDVVVSRFLATCEESRRIVEDHSLAEVVQSELCGHPVNLRYIAVHMIEEYARHCGHADFLRERIDGTVGD